VAAGPGSGPLLPGNPAHTVIVAGDGAGPTARRLAQAQGWPLFAEPTSGALGGRTAIHGYRELLTITHLAAMIEQVVVFGHPTLSRPIERLLGRDDVTVTVVAPGGGPWPDSARNAALVIDALPDSWLTDNAAEAATDTVAVELAEPATDKAADEISDKAADEMIDAKAAAGAFLRRWLAASDAAAEVIDRASAAANFDGANAALVVARAVAAATGPGDFLLVGASNPVRDLDLVLGIANGDRGAAAGTVVSNRGLAGIDGTIATATGIALGVQPDGGAASAGTAEAATGIALAVQPDGGAVSAGTAEAATGIALGVQPDGGAVSASTAAPASTAVASDSHVVRALLGDLAFVHDAGSLLRGPLEPVADLQLVVVNDDGGSIFATLEHGALAQTSADAQARFERVFGTPHGTDIAGLCAGYGAGYRLVDTVAGLRAALAEVPVGALVMAVRVPRAERYADMGPQRAETTAAAATAGQSNGETDHDGVA
jgi:2-succinyl-5-enolpyruvyl-6-hydroxy-3-cyclohexene-1-carboxylate synthase